MKRIWILPLLALLGALVFVAPVTAQEEEPVQPTQTRGLVLFTPYPSEFVGLGENISMKLTLRTGSDPQIVTLEMGELPEGWTATFKAGDRVIRSVYVDSERDAAFDLRLEPPPDVAPGNYRFVVLARGDTTVELPVELSVLEKVPPSLALDVELPTLRGAPTTTFRYNATLRNEGDEDLDVNLVADVPTGFLVNFKLSGQDVTSIPLAANETKRLTVEAQPIGELPAGQYPIAVTALGEGNVQASVQLMAEVTGQPDLVITGPDGRLSAQAYAGRESPLKIVIRNSGTAPALGLELSSSEPNGWAVEFEPKSIPEIPAGEQVEVTARIQPAEKAVAGDYMLTVRARPAEGGTQSADFRITVLTSTLWGVVGIGLIAVAVGVVALAVVRFGRR